MSCKGYNYHVFALGADRCSICGQLRAELDKENQAPPKRPKPPPRSKPTYGEVFINAKDLERLVNAIKKAIPVMVNNRELRWLESSVKKARRILSAFGRKKR
jgi:hypothetical protein